MTVAEFLMDLLPKQQKRTLSGTTLYEVHQLLHNSFLLAVEWGILIKSPVPVEAPKKTTQERRIWEVEEMRAALDSMEDPILHLAVHLTLVGALREGEVAGLTPEDIDFDAANGMGTFTVNRSMQRVQKDTKPDTSSPQAVPAAGEPTISMTALLELLKDADPEMKAKLRLALLT